MLEFSIITITSFVTILDTCTILIAKSFTKGDFKRFIPIFSLVYGVILGIIGFYMPSVEMGTNIVEAIFVGLSAGAAATGVNQVGKQLGKDDSISSILLYLKSFVDDANAMQPEENEIVVDEDVINDEENETVEEEIPVEEENE